MLEVQGLSVTYPSKDKPSIQNISFSLKQGEFVWLAGESASGKSTLMNCICGFIPQIIPADLKGSIIFHGKKNLEPLQLSRHITMVHQDPETQFCTETVEDEIAFGLENRCLSRRKIDKRIETTLRDLNCSELRYRELRTLSGGEKQKIAIASMLVLNPRVLILDEPTSNLDPISMNEVLNAIENVRRKSHDLTIILAEHRIGNLVEQIDRVLKLEDGELTRDIRDFQDLEQKNSIMDYSYPEYSREGVKDGETLLKIKNMDHTLAGKKILKDIDLKVRKGEIIALMGRNGSGKTTLVKLISALSEVHEGKIKIFDRVMDRSNKVQPYELGKRIGYVFQNPNHQIFENSLEEEIKFATKNFSKGGAKAKKWLKKITTEENLDGKTHPHTLSFGQKRRLNIYSSSPHNPELIVIDEPFSGQDHQNALMIADILDDLWKKGKTLIVVTHNLEFAKKFCTRALVLKEGEIVYDGEPDNLKSVSGEDGR